VWFSLIINVPDEKINQTSKYITSYWDELINPPDKANKDLPIPNPYVTPSKKFNAFFYWDTYFTILGLFVDDHYKLAVGSVKNFIAEIEKMGFIPNYNGPGWISKTRSQPPFFSQMVLELFSMSNDITLLKEFIEPLEKEYTYWTSPPKLFKFGLARYFDTSFFAKFQHYSAMAESGWDFTNRFRNIKESLPVDLNTLLALQERTIWQILGIIGNGSAEETEKWKSLFKKRTDLINQYMWDENRKFFYDFSTAQNRPEKSSSLAGYFPMWANLLDDERAAWCAKKLEEFLKLGGLATTLDDKIDGFRVLMKFKGLQWCYPAGWAPLHWIVIKGLSNYNYDIVAAEASLRFLRLVSEIFNEKGVIFEKYNVVDKNTKVKAAYSMHTGFGWTNSVFQTLLARIIMGIEPELNLGFRFSPRIPDEWQNKEISVSFNNYPKLGLNLALTIEDKRKEEQIIEYLITVNKPIEVELRFFKKEENPFTSILINDEEQLNEFNIETIGNSIERKTIATASAISLKSGENKISIS